MLTREQVQQEVSRSLPRQYLQQQRQQQQRQVHVTPQQSTPLHQCNRKKKQEDHMLDHQHAVWYVAHQHATDAPETPKNSRGLLVWHSTGSGKTLTTAAILHAFWGSSRFRRLVVSSTPNALKANPPARYFDLLSRFFDVTAAAGKKTTAAAAATPASSPTVATMATKRGVVFMSLAQLAHAAALAKATKGAKSNYLADAVLIIDEAHNLFKPPPGQAPEMEAIREFLSSGPIAGNKGTKVFLLTATPGEDAEQIAFMLNAVRDPWTTSELISAPDVQDSRQVAEFQGRTMGLVSFYDMSSDETRFPRVIDVDLHRVAMSLEQFTRYLQADSMLRRSAMQQLPGGVAVRKLEEQALLRYSNMPFQWHVDSKKSVNDDAQLQRFSPKLHALISTIMKYPTEKHYVYSAFYHRRGFGGHGILAIARVLQDRGWRELTPAQAAQEVTTLQQQQQQQQQQSTDMANLQTQHGGPRFVLATVRNLTKSSAKDAGKGKEATANLANLITVFNSTANRYGQLVRVFLASQSYNESIDLRAVRHIHIFEPFHDSGVEKQTIGRAVRFCSHSQLDRSAGEWLVQVHRYISDIPYSLLRSMQRALRTQLEQLDKPRAPLAAARAIQAQLDTVERVLSTGVVVIDDLVREKAASASIRLRVLHQLMINNAVDCAMFRTFHLSRYPQTQCSSSSSSSSAV
jgi:hypothetical protein